MDPYIFLRKTTKDGGPGRFTVYDPLKRCQNILKAFSVFLKTHFIICVVRIRNEF